MCQGEAGLRHLRVVRNAKVPDTDPRGPAQTPRLSTRKGVAHCSRNDRVNSHTIHRTEAPMRIEKRKGIASDDSGVWVTAFQVNDGGEW